MKKNPTYEKSFQHDAFLPQAWEIDGRIYEFREIRIDVIEHPFFINAE